ncbi:MAG TPA: Na/Pi symporter [Longimicrobiales bacterium]|nr:Na/Pi symporter [Longimicrobiales bacterium]
MTTAKGSALSDYTRVSLRIALVALFLYLFLVGIAFIESGIAAMGAGFQARLLQSVSNPISGLCAGLLATVLTQSSSVTTSTIVGMVGAGTLPLTLAVPMIMGANLGTTVTSTLASLGSIRRPAEFRLAFSAATVHDMFNWLGVIILLPLEIATGFLGKTALWLANTIRGAEIEAGAPSPSVIRTAVKYPVDLIAGVVPENAFMSVLLLGIGLALLFVALAMITRTMRRLVAASVERVMNRIIGRGGGAIGILVGLGVTVAVQSSSITTSILVPLVASGILSLRNAFPITVGANIGTTVTALIASLAVLLPEGLAIALVHTLFNTITMIIIFGIPPLRQLPVRMAEGLANLAMKRRSVIVIYGAGFFIVLPLLGILLIR